MKILKPFFGIVCLLLITTACEEQQRNFGEPPREYDAQSAVDNDSLISFLQKRFYNYEDYATARKQNLLFLISLMTRLFKRN